MLRGLLAGLLSGTAVSGLVLGAISLMSEVPGTRAPEATALDVPAGSEFDRQREDEQATLTPLEDATPPAPVPQVDAPAPDDLSSLADADTAPASVPETGDAEGALAEPEAPQAGADVSVEAEDPVLPNPQAVAPEVPPQEDDLSISTVPAQPVLPEAEESAFPDPAPAPQDTSPEAPAQTTERSGADAPAQAPEPAPDSQAAAQPDPAPARPQEPADPTAETEGEETAPTGTIRDLAQGVTTDRLPSVGDPESAAQAAPPEDTATDASQEADAQDALPAIARHAAPFENPEGKPLMSIVLMDDGTSPIGPAALADFPYPISFAVDATHPDAARIARAYRAAGLEVLALADLPATATAQDAEVAIAETLRAVPEAVAVMEGTRTGLQGSREAAEQLAPILLDEGHGLLMFPNGLDTLQKLIAREGVPAATIFRDFDSEGQNATVIRRFLDQAAFRATREEDGVIMVGRLRPDTISALLLWGLQDRAASVALAPVSAVLTAD